MKNKMFRVNYYNIIIVVALLASTCRINAQSGSSNETTNQEEITIIEETIEIVDAEQVEVEQTIDFNLHFPQMVKYGDHEYLRKYWQLPDPTSFFMIDVYHSKVSKFIHYDQILLPLFDKWNETSFSGQNYLSLFTFADVRDHNGVVKKTNLNTFLSQLVSINATGNVNNVKNLHLNYTMPDFIRDKIEMPSILRCKLLEEWLEDVTMEFYYNQQEFTETKFSDTESLVCFLKGNVSYVMMNRTSSHVLLGKNNLLDKSDYKTTKFLNPNVGAGDCLFIPSGWFYAFQTNYTWFFTIQFHSMMKLLHNEEACNNAKENTTIGSYKYRNEKFDKDALIQRLGLSLYFFIYTDNNSSKQIHFEEFLTRFKNDKNLTTPYMMEWNSTMEEKVNDIFKAVDYDQDNIFTIGDLYHINEVNSENAQKVIFDRLVSLQKIFLEQMGEKKKLFDDLVTQLNSVLGDDDDVSKKDLLREKISQALYNMPDDVKDKFKSEDIDLEDLIMAELERSRQDSKQNSKREKRKKDKSKSEDKNDEAINKEEVEEKISSFVEIDDSKIEDIDADSDESNNVRKDEL